LPFINHDAKKIDSLAIDGHDGVTDSLGWHTDILEEHFHSAQKVYPTLADGVTLTTESGDWQLGTITQIVPADAIGSMFDIHEVIVETVNTQDKAYELVLYYGASDTECGRVRFRADTNKGSVNVATMQTPLIPADSKISGALAIQDGGSKTAVISLRYHLY